MKRVLCVLMLSVFMAPSFASNLDLPIEEYKMDCDTYALWVYENNLEMGMGQQQMSIRRNMPDAPGLVAIVSILLK